MRFLKLTVAYDGSDYVGWQVQPNGVTVQQRLEEAWSQTTGEQIRIIASGRTDSGVHAEGQVCSIETATDLDSSTLVRALNANTPEDISVLEIKNAPTGFHAIRDAVRKTYRYQIQFGRIRNPIGRHQRWFVPSLTDPESMVQAATWLQGEHDFASFQAAGSDRQTTVRNLEKIQLHQRQQSEFQYMDIELTSNGFLYNMVRNIVGTLIAVGQQRQSPDWVRWVLDQKARQYAGPTAPPHGLFLVQVDYDLSFS